MRKIWSLVSRDYSHRQQVLDITGVFVSGGWLVLTPRNLGTIWRDVDAGSSGDREFGLGKCDALAVVSDGQFGW